MAWRQAHRHKHGHKTTEREAPPAASETTEPPAGLFLWKVAAQSLLYARPPTKARGLGLGPLASLSLIPGHYQITIWQI